MKIDKDLIKKLFFKCDSCKGKGYSEVADHDCWGKQEWRVIGCHYCDCNGYTTLPELKIAIKKTLGI